MHILGELYPHSVASVPPFPSPVQGTLRCETCYTPAEGAAPASPALMAKFFTSLTFAACSGEVKRWSFRVSARLKRRLHSCEAWEKGMQCAPSISRKSRQHTYCTQEHPTLALDDEARAFAPQLPLGTCRICERQSV